MIQFIKSDKMQYGKKTAACKRGVIMSRGVRIASVFFLLGAGLAFAQEKTALTVTVRTAQIRSRPSYLGAVLEKVAYVKTVKAGEPQKGWVKVIRPSGKGKGWLNLSALTNYKGKLKAGGKTTSHGASSGEVAAAGKGFTKKIENEQWPGTREKL